MKKGIGGITLLFSVVLLSIGIGGITGNVTGSYFQGRFLFIHIIGFTLLLASIFIMTGRKSLDYLLIPDGSEKMREKRDYRVMEELARRRGNVKEIFLMDGKDSEEDVLYLGRMLKGGEKIGIVTFPEHYREYRELIRKAKRDKKFPRFVKVKEINTRKPGKNLNEKWYNIKEAIYGHLGLWEEKLKRRKLDYVENRKEDFYMKFKNVVKKIIGL